MTNLSKALEVLARQPLPETVERYDAATHIFNWAASDAGLYREMKKVREPGFFLSARGQAQAALNLAFETTRRGKNDIPRALVEPVDLIRAAGMFLQWEGEGR